MLRFALAALFALQGFSFTLAATASAQSGDRTTPTEDVEVRQVGVEQERDEDAPAHAERRPTTRERRLAREAARRPFRSLGSATDAEILSNLSLF